MNRNLQALGIGTLAFLAARGTLDEAVLVNQHDPSFNPPGIEAQLEGTAVLVIDMEERFLRNLDFMIEDTPEFREKFGWADEETLRLWQRNVNRYNDMIYRQARAIEEYKEQGYPIIVVEYSYKDKDGEIVIQDDTFPRIMDAARGPGNWLYTKTENNAFHSGDLAEHLRELGIGNVILMGLNYPACVDDTWYGGKAAGFTIHIRHDLVLNIERGPRY